MRSIRIYLSFILLIFVAMNSNAQNPDFAFPKTVSKNADRDLKSAIEHRNAHAALNAFIRYCVAENQIDESLLPQNLQLLDTITSKFNDDNLQPIFYALQAYLYNAYYEDDRWKFDRRELPLDPIPIDITEWSGEIFRIKIKDLLHKSVARPESLLNQPIQDYKDIITANTTTAYFYPTLLDFVCENAIAIASRIDENTSMYLDVATAYSTDPVMWQCRKIVEDKSRDDLKSLKELYLKNIDTPYCAYALNEYCKWLNNSSFYENDEDEIDDEQETINTTVDVKKYKNQAWAISQIDSLTSRYPTSPLCEDLLSHRENFLRLYASVTFPSYVALGHELTVAVNYKNAATVDVNLYKLPLAYKDKRSVTQNLLNRSTPVQTITLRCSESAPFECLDTVKFTVSERGLYTVLVKLPGEEYRDESMNMCWCIENMPALIRTPERCIAVVANAYNGAPASRQCVTVSYDKSSYKSHPTDAEGMVDITSVIRKTKYNQGNVDLDTPEGIVPFQIWVSAGKNHNVGGTQYSASVLTDRAIYRPGDEVNVMAIFSSLNTGDKLQSNSKLEANIDVRLVMLDANYQSVDTIIGKTDDYGRFVGSFKLPTDGLTGTFTIIASQNSRTEVGRTTIKVAEYKMPDFELCDLNIVRDQPAKGDITVTGKARMYSGMPVAHADISAILNSSSWMRWRISNNKIWSAETTTDTDGTFSIIIPDSIFKANPDDRWFSVSVDATSPIGTTSSDYVQFSIGKPYSIMISTVSNNVDGAVPFNPTINIYGPDGKPAVLPLRWALKHDNDTVAEGEVGAPIDLSKVTPGAYTFTVYTSDSELADPESTSITIFNRNTDIVPDSAPLWLEKTSLTASGSQIKVPFGIPGEANTLYYAIGVGDSIASVNTIEVKHGYHDLTVEIPDNANDAELQILLIQNCKALNYRVEIKRVQHNELKIQAESFRDRLTPGGNETWTFQILDAKGAPVPAAIAIDMYNKALEALAPHSFSLYFPRFRSNPNISISTAYSYQQSNSMVSNISTFRHLNLEAPEFYFYGYGFCFGVKEFSRMMPMAVKSCYSAPAGCMDAVYEDNCAMPDMGAAAIENESVTEGQELETEALPNDKFDFREAALPLAIWAPSLVTDSEGQLKYTFQAPNAVTTWRMICIAWSKDMEIGNMMRDIIANKPVMVQANTPRFMRVGDTVAISALVQNNSDEQGAVTSIIEIFNPLNGEVLKTETIDLEIPPMQSATATIIATATGDMSALGYRIRSTMGAFTDGEQTVIPVLSSMAQLVETEPFYLNPGDTEYATRLPEDDGARITLTFSENPVWSVVSALPGLRAQISDYANSAAAAMFSAALAQGIIRDNPKVAEALKYWAENPTDSALVSMLAKNEDLKIALLNSTPWVEASLSDSERMARLYDIFDQKATDSAIEQAITILSDLQRSDGGWAWGKWCDRSSVWVTSNVIEMFADLKAHGWLPSDSRLSDMIKRALRFWDKEVSRMYPGQKQLSPDIEYSLIRPQFSATPIEARGKEVIDITLRDIEKHWKKYTAPATKAMAAQTLWVNGQRKEAQQLMASLSEFGVDTPSQGIKFPNENSLAAYAIILEAYAWIQPESRYVDGLRQQLIVRKQGTDWGSAVVTSQVVAGILSCGSNWTVDAEGAHIYAGDEQIKPNSEIERYTGSMKADLSKYAGKLLKIETSGNGPAYGAVFAQMQRVMDRVEASSCDDLSVLKQMTVRRGTGWEMMPDTLQIGDRVKIQLTIHCKRNLDYVTIVDDRAACFEPVEQIPGWLWSENTAFYRENRDSSTNLFVISLQPGTYLLTYEMTVSHAGQFSSGVATVQSQYAPEISAHSQGTRLNVK